MNTSHARDHGQDRRAFADHLVIVITDAVRETTPIAAPRPATISTGTIGVMAGRAGNTLTDQAAAEIADRCVRILCHDGIPATRTA